MAYNLNGEITTKSSECKERQRLRAEEMVSSHDNAKLLNDDDNSGVVQGSCEAHSTGTGAETAQRSISSQ